MKSIRRNNQPDPAVKRFVVTGIMLLLTSALVLLSSSGCSGTGEPSEMYSVETLDSGVVRVTHHQLSLKTLTPDTVGIWNLWEEDSGYFFNNISAADGAEGGFYLCDLGNRQVVKVDLEGKAQFSFGRSGQGPGEFRFPFSLKVFGDQVWVADMMNNRFSVFGLDGSYLRDLRWEGYRWFGGGFHLVGDNRVLSAAQTFVGFEDTEEIDPVFSVVIFDLDSGESDTLATMTGLRNHQITVSSMTGQGMTFIGPPKFAPGLHWTFAGEDRLLTVTGLDYRFEERDLRGRVHREVLAPAPDLTVTQRDRKWFLEEEGMRFGFGTGEVFTATRTSLENYPFAERRQAIEAISVDPLGRIWVLANTEDPGSKRMDLFDREGGYLGSLGDFPMPISFNREGLALLQISDRESMDIFYVVNVPESPMEQ